MDNNFNNDNMQPNQFPQNNDYPPQGGGNDYSAQFAQYNQSRNPADGGNGDYNNPYQPQQPAQPDYNQYQPQQPVQPDYNQYQPQQPAQPDYNQYQPQQPVQPDYNQYQPQQPAQPDYNQYQPQQADYNQYNQYQDTNVQPYDYNQNGYQQPYDYNAGAQPAYSMPADAPTGAAKVFGIISFVCGILSMITCCYGLFTGIPGLIFAIVSKSKFKGKNTMAQLGLIFSIVGMALSVIWIIVAIVTGIFNGSSSSSYHYYY